MQINSVHFYVTDAQNTSNWFINHLGFQLVDSYRDDDCLTFALSDKSILFVISSPLNKVNSVAKYLDNHAEGIVDLTFCVKDLHSIINRANHCGIKILQPIQQQGKIKYSSLAGWGCLQHTLIESCLPINCYLLPNGKLKSFGVSSNLQKSLLEITNIDHIVLNVAQGKLIQAVSYYQSIFDFKVKQIFQIETKRSGLYSQALIDRTGQVQFNINEPISINSQIQEFIEYNGGSGIQHLALKSRNLVQDVIKMRSLDVPFLPIPATYYSQLKQRLERDLIKFSTLELQSIIDQSILIDWQQNNAKSLLMQIFTQPILKQPTFFLEFIERRKQAIGFGEGNFQALFVAVEQEQIKNNVSSES